MAEYLAVAIILFSCQQTMTEGEVIIGVAVHIDLLIRDGQTTAKVFSIIWVSLKIA